MPKLTNMQRDMIINRIMSDVPKVDFEGMMRARAVEICESLMPKEIQRVWANASLRGYLACGSYVYHSISLQTPGFKSYDDEVKAAFLADSTLASLHASRDNQRTARQKLQADLQASVYSCATHAAFRERFPELAKYLPKEAALPANLPATTALMDTLKNAGLKLEISDAREPAQ